MISLQCIGWCNCVHCMLGAWRAQGMTWYMYIPLVSYPDQDGQCDVNYFTNTCIQTHTGPDLCPLRGNDACNGRLVMSLCHTLWAHQESDLPQYCNRYGNSYNYEIVTFTMEEVLKQWLLYYVFNEIRVICVHTLYAVDS